jgi:nucleoside-diphosphate-sugar epimerase
MRVLIAGGTGAIGRRLLPLLAASGHEVTAMSRSGRPLDDAASIAADALDAGAVKQAVAQAQPDVVINLLTAIPDPVNAKKMAQQFALTNRLRDEGTRNLIAAAPGRVISESIAFAYAPADGLADEDARLWDDPPKEFTSVLAGVRALEQHTLDAGGTVLRLGHLHGPGTSFGAGGGFRAAVQSRKLPVVGGGTAVFSFVHVDDVAAAFAAALTGPTGTYNVVDDQPAPVAAWLPSYATMLDARPPGRVPAGIAKLAVGGWGVAFMTQLRGADNSRAKQRLDWRPTRGWRETLAS